MANKLIKTSSISFANSSLLGIYCLRIVRHVHKDSCGWKLSHHNNKKLNTNKMSYLMRLVKQIVEHSYNGKE